LKVQILKSSEWVHDNGKPRLGYAFVIEIVSDSKIGDAAVSAAVEHTDLQGIETGNVEFEANGDAAARFLGVGGDLTQGDAIPHKKYSHKRTRTGSPAIIDVPPRPSGIPDR